MTIYELLCRRCGGPFQICSSCYRGHAYCADSCRRSGRADSERRARRKFKQSERGRAQNAERQRRHRAERKVSVQGVVASYAARPRVGGEVEEDRYGVGLLVMRLKPQCCFGRPAHGPWVAAQERELGCRLRSLTRPETRAGCGPAADRSR